MMIRQALLADVAGIVKIFRSWDAADVDALPLFERWQQGGAWYSVETCAVWVGRLLQTEDCIPLAAEQDGVLMGYAEVYIGREAAPYGDHVHVGLLKIHADAEPAPMIHALLDYICEMARVLGCRRVTGFPQETVLYESFGLAPWLAFHIVTLPAEEGRVFYQARELTDIRPQQIHGWHMPLGRFQNGRAEWERMYWMIWNGVPQLVEADWHRLVIDLTAQPGILHLHQQRQDPTEAVARLWTKNTPSGHILSAVRDRAARLGYGRVLTYIEAGVLPAVQSVAQHIGDAEWLYAVDIGS